MALLDHLEKLRHFSGVAKAGSIRGYAVAHRLSQPAVSKAVRILETDLETTLLVRSKDGVSLTPSGSQLLELADEVLSKAKSAEERIRTRGNISLKGHFVLGTYQSIAVYFLPKLLNHLNRVQKNIRIDCVTAPSAMLVKTLQSSSIDFIISIDPPKLRGAAHIELFEDTYSVYCHVLNREDSRRSSTNTLIFTLSGAKDTEGKDLRHYIEKAGLLGRISECGDFEAAKSMVENNVGWGLLPERVASQLVNDGKIRKVTSLPKLQSIGRHKVVFSCLKHHASDHRIRWIAEQIRLMLRSET
jgi:DNA-binding transcriptional LysR family regulator